MTCGRIPNLRRLAEERRENDNTEKEEEEKGGGGDDHDNDEDGDDHDGFVLFFSLSLSFPLLIFEDFFFLEDDSVPLVCSITARGACSS